MILRTEQQTDHLTVYQLNEMAFGDRIDEAELVKRIRKSDGFIPSLSIVAEVEGTIVGHLLLSKAVITDKTNVEVLVLAPVAVHPLHQREGIGGQLIREGLKRGKEAGYGLVLLIGHPNYYPKFGFKPARPFGLELSQFQVPDEVFMVCELVEDALTGVKGELKYPPAFFADVEDRTDA